MFIAFLAVREKEYLDVFSANWYSGYIIQELRVHFTGGACHFPLNSNLPAKLAP